MTCGTYEILSAITIYIPSGLLHGWRSEIPSNTRGCSQKPSYWNWKVDFTSSVYARGDSLTILGMGNHPTWKIGNPKINGYIYTLIRMVDGWWPSSMNAMGPGSWRISTEAKEALIAATPHEIAQLFQREVLFCFFSTGTKKGMATPRYQRFFAAFYHVFVFWPVKYQGNGLRTYLSLCLYIYLMYIDLI